MWQFAEACRGLKDACLELGIPVTGGNVSLYNQTGETAILPTPVVAVLGVIEDVTRRTPTGFPAPGTGCCCSARPARSCPARSGPTSCTATSAACRPGRPGRRAGAEPSCSSTRDRACCPRPTTSPTAAWRRRWWSPACATGSVSGSSWRVAGGDPFVALFSESAGRVVVSVDPGRRGAALRGSPPSTAYPITSLGETRRRLAVGDRPVRRTPRRAARRLDRHAPCRPGGDRPHTSRVRQVAGSG